MYFRRLARSCQRRGGGTIGQFCEYSEEQRNFWFLLLLALGVGLRLARVEVRVVVAVVVLVLVGLLLLDVALVLQGLPGEEEHRPGHDALADVVPDLEVSGEQGLCILIHLGIGIVRNSGGVEEVEEAVRLDLLRDRPHAPLALVLLLLLHLLHRQVLPLLPVNWTPCTLEDLWALKGEWVILRWFTLHLLTLPL